MLLLVSHGLQIGLVHLASSLLREKFSKKLKEKKNKLRNQ